MGRPGEVYDWGVLTDPWDPAANSTEDIKPPMKYKGTVYLSGPITGLSYGESRYGWREYAAQRFEGKIKALSPMRHEGHLAEISGEMREGMTSHHFSAPRVIVEKDFLDIDRSDIMLVHLIEPRGFPEQQVISRGTLVEIGYAAAKGKRIVLVMEKEGNPHASPFVTETAMLWLDDLDEAIAAINSLLSEGV